MYSAPASQLAPYAGEVIVGAENAFRFWVVRPTRAAFTALPFRTVSPRGKVSLVKLKDLVVNTHRVDYLAW